MPATKTLDRARLGRLMTRELATFETDHPRSKALHEQAKASLLDGVPMNWMIRWAALPALRRIGRGRPFP